ncbi:hypothetical protein RI367_007676 [Sorochytrium milnesiophthora]
MKKPKLTAQLGRLLDQQARRKAQRRPEQEAKPKAAVPRRPVVPYRDDHHILLVGEGNFSFAAALVGVLGTGENIVATAYDSADVVHEKYPDAQALIDNFVQDFGGQVLYDCDGTQLAKYKALRGKVFDRIVFNFPHVGLGIKDQARNIVANQNLISEFFRSCTPFLRTRPRGEIVVTIKTGEPYDSWNIKTLAKTAKLVCKTSFAFSPADYPGYEHRRTLGFSPGTTKDDNAEIAKGARSYVFVVADDDTLVEIERTRAGMQQRKRPATADTHAAEKRKRRRAEERRDDSE